VAGNLRSEVYMALASTKPMKPGPPAAAPSEPASPSEAPDHDADTRDRPSPASGSPRTRIAAAVVAAALVGGLAWLRLRPAPTAVPAFRTVAVQRGDLHVTVGATGTIEPEEVVDVGAQVIGMIREFGRNPGDESRRVDYGSVVEEGTVLARIDDTFYEAQRDQAQANAQRARADRLQLEAKLRQAEREWERAQRLRRTGVMSEADYDVALANVETARSSLAVGEASIVQADAALRQAEINLGYTTIRSPVRGVIVDRRVNIGQTVVSSLNAPSLFLIAKDLGRLQVWASVNEADVGRIRPGQPVTFTVDAYPGEQFRGQVAQLRLNATMTQNVVTYTVVVTTDNADGRLLPYLTASLHFTVEERQGVLLVPNAALRWQPDPQEIAPEARAAERAGTEPDRGLLWMTDGRLVRPIPVHVGPSDGLVTEIVSDRLRDGDAVVVGEAAAGEETTEASPFTPRFFGR
jgi:HlyD family secretion protein